MSTNNLKTTGDVAKQIGVSRQNVDYAISRYRIQETQRAGIVRLFDAGAVNRIMRAINRTSRENCNNGY